MDLLIEALESAANRGWTEDVNRVVEYRLREAWGELNSADELQVRADELSAEWAAEDRAREIALGIRPASFSDEPCTSGCCA